MGIWSCLAALDRGAWAPRAGRGTRRATFYSDTGNFRKLDKTAARTSLGFTGPAEVALVFGMPHPRRYAAGLGACRVYQACALGGGRPGFRFDHGSCGPLSQRQSRRSAATGDLEVQPAGTVDRRRRNVADS